MTLPPWADEEFSEQLPEIIAAGEGQRTEFKKDFDRQASSLCAEVAAFATSGGGNVLIGVTKEGDPIGLKGDSDDERQRLKLRAQNLIKNVKPTVDCRVVLGLHCGRCILGIVIALKQDQPLFYYEHRPYIRDGSESRPATPDEVKDLVWSHPSSEHRRRMQDLQYALAKGHQELSLKRQERSDAATERATERILGLRELR